MQTKIMKKESSILSLILKEFSKSGGRLLIWVGVMSLFLPIKFLRYSFRMMYLKSRKLQEEILF